MRCSGLQVMGPVSPRFLVGRGAVLQPVLLVMADIMDAVRNINHDCSARQHSDPVDRPRVGTHVRSLHPQFHSFENRG